jgi:tetratricopeptide (TPR) repeat protein
VLAQQTDYAGAIACYNKGLQIDPNLAVGHLYLGLALMYSGDLAGAKQALTQALKLFPPAHPGYGLAQQQLQQCEKLLHGQKGPARESPFGP